MVNPNAILYLICPMIHQELLHRIWFSYELPKDSANWTLLNPIHFIPLLVYSCRLQPTWMRNPPSHTYIYPGTMLLLWALPQYYLMKRIINLELICISQRRWETETRWRKHQKRLKKDKNVLKPTIQRVSTANKKQSQVILDSLIFKNPFFVWERKSWEKETKDTLIILG
jgi:hypothetical protein